MVSIIPSERTPWDVIGSQLGQNISQNLPGAVQQGFQRQTGLNAIDELEKGLKAANGDLTKMLPLVAKAYTQNPALERSGIAEKLVPLLQRSEAAKNPIGESSLSNGGSPNQPGGSKAQNQGKAISVDQLVEPQGYLQDPQGVSQFQLPFAEDKIKQIRQVSRERNYSPELEERLVNDAKEMNEVATQRRDAEISNYNQQQQQRRDTIENQAAFNTYLSENAPEFAKNPDEKALALEASEEFADEKSFSRRLEKVKEKLRPYQAAKNALEKGLLRPLTGYTPEQLALMQKRAQFMVQKGQKPQLQLMIAKAGHGEAEEAQLLNPLPQDFQKGIKRFNNFIDPLSQVTNLDPESAEYSKQQDIGLKKLSNQREQMTDYLSRNIRPGTFKEPGTNLVLVRKDLMDKEATWDQSGKIIDDAIAKGEIELDPQQKIDYQRLGYPPLQGDTYFDTIMNHLMFPVTGKQ